MRNFQSQPFKSFHFLQNIFLVTLFLTFIAFANAVLPSKDLPEFGGGFSLGVGFGKFNESTSRFGFRQGKSLFSRMCGNCQNYILYSGWQLEWKTVSFQFLMDLIIAISYLSVPVQLYFMVKDLEVM